MGRPRCDRALEAFDLRSQRLEQRRPPVRPQVLVREELGLRRDSDGLVVRRRRGARRLRGDRALDGVEMRAQCATRRFRQSRGFVRWSSKYAR
jgi:hypothetical protein